MKIAFNRRKIETACILISFILFVILSLSLIFIIADETFGWDIFPEDIEKVLTLILGAFGVIITATFLISLMVNLSLISFNIEEIANRLSSRKDLHSQE